MLGKAISLTAQAFENVKDKGGHPYMLHCFRVMNNLNTKDEELNCIAILHDYVEDIWAGKEDEGLNYLRDQGFSHRVVEAIHLLTHRKDFPYDDYIKHLSLNTDARKVKMADLEDNSQITRLKGLSKKDFDRMEQYHRAYTYLKY